MKKVWVQCLATFVLMLSLTVPAVAAGVTDAVPTIKVEQLTRILQESSGKVVLINFFASWCPPCREEMPSLVRLRKLYSPDQVVFVGLSVDQDMSALKKFLADDPINYPVYVADMELAYMYGVQAIPHNAVYDKAGELVANQPGLIEESDLRQALDSLLREN